MNLNPLFLYHTSIQNPKTRLLTIFATVFYLVFPLDFSPDFLPVLGQIDDGVLGLMLLVELILLWRGRSKKKIIEQSQVQIPNQTKNPVL